MLTVDASADEVTVGATIGTMDGRLGVQQFSTTAAKPVVHLEQLDTSEEVWLIEAAGGSGTTIETTDLTPGSLSHRLMVKLIVNGAGEQTRYINLYNK